MTRTTLVRRTPLAVAAVAALTLVAAPAFAAPTPVVTGTTVDVGGTAGSDALTVSCQTGTGLLDVGNGTPTTVTCAQLTGLTIDLGAGVDTFAWTGVTGASFPALPYVDITSDDGEAETVQGSPVRDLVTADATDTVNTGDDQDTITGGLITDGGGGNDRFVDHALGGSVTGGDGTDVVEYAYDSPAQRDLAVSFTLTDTSYTTQGATVSTNGVERYDLSFPDGANPVNSVDAGALTNARVVARLQSGADTFTGGTGNDYVDAGPGTDTIDPGAGNDSVQGGEGTDTINVQDGEVDVVDCGDGVDTVTADRTDVLKNCENVTLPPLPPTPEVAPETGGVLGFKKVTRGAQESFVFVSPTSGATFECRLDTRNWKTCRSPYKLRTGNLKVGKHKLYVRAVLPGANVDATPSKFGFTVQKPKKHRR